MVKARANKIPKKLQAVLWSVDVDQLNTQRDKHYIIAQVLLYGTFEEIRWLFNTYTRSEIVDSFVNHPIKMYPRNVFYFVKNFILGLRERRLPEEKYVTAISGPIEPRATRGI